MLVLAPNLVAQFVPVVLVAALRDGALLTAVLSREPSDHNAAVSHFQRDGFHSNFALRSRRKQPLRSCLCPDLLFNLRMQV